MSGMTLNLGRSLYKEPEPIPDPDVDAYLGSEWTTDYTPIMVGEEGSTNEKRFSTYFRSSSFTLSYGDDYVIKDLAEGQTTPTASIDDVSNAYYLRGCGVKKNETSTDSSVDRTFYTLASGASTTLANLVRDDVLRNFPKITNAIDSPNRTIRYAHIGLTACTSSTFKMTNCFNLRDVCGGQLGDGRFHVRFDLKNPTDDAILYVRPAGGDSDYLPSDFASYSYSASLRPIEGVTSQSKIWSDYDGDHVTATYQVSSSYRFFIMGINLYSS